MDLNLKIEGSIPPWVMSLSFLLAFACTEKSVLVIEASFLEDLGRSHHKKGSSGEQGEADQQKKQSSFPSQKRGSNSRPCIVVAQ